MRQLLLVPMCLVAVGLVAVVAGEGAAQAAPGGGFEALTRRMADAKVSVNAEQSPPDQVFDLIRKAAGVNIVIRPDVRKAWEGKTVSMTLDDVSALSAFHHLLRYLDLSAFYADEAMVVTTPESVRPAPQIYVYDIRDIVDAPRSFYLPPTLFGSQIDPLHYYFKELDPEFLFQDTRNFTEFIADMDSLERYPPDPFGHVIADVIERKTNARERGVSVTYEAGYLIVVEQPTPARLAPGEGDIKDALLPEERE